MRELHDRLENNLDLKCSEYSCTNITIIIVVLYHKQTTEELSKETPYDYGVTPLLVCAAVDKLISSTWYNSKEM
jgi:hypothetical protein